MPDTLFNSKDLTRAIAQKLQLPTDTAEAVLKEFQNIVIQQLKDGSEVRLTGFGTFKTIKRGAREARNPRTGEKIDVPGHTVVRFVPGKHLKEFGGELS